jgi:GNAT superfamily N-acetyltransferase
MNDDFQLRAARAGTTLRAIDTRDLEAMHRLALQMSWPHRLVDCALLLELGRGVVATDATNEVVGVGMWWGFGKSAATIGMVLVAPEHQGKGIGRALMSALITDAGERTLALNATAEGLGLYEKLGFGRTGLVRQHQARLVEVLTTSAVPPVPVRHARPADFEALRTLDAAAFGASRAALIGRLLATGEAWVIDGDAGPTGFAILRAFGRGQMIGPVVAANEDEAIALVAAAARAASPGVLRIDIPAHAQHLAGWLADHGLPAIDTVTAMLRGPWPLAQAGVQRFGLALQALG